MKTTKNKTNFSFSIIEDYKFLDDYFGVTEEIRLVLDSMNQKVDNKKSYAIRELNDLIDNYPHIPQFKGLLVTLYEKLGNNQKFVEISEWIIKDHPDYILGRVLLASEYILKEQFEKVPGILGNPMELKYLYPHRKEFHISEVVSFYLITTYYFVGIGDLDEANLRLEILKNLKEDYRYSITDDDIERINFVISRYKINKGLEWYSKLREKARNVKVIPVEVVEQTLEKPVFTHEIIEQLYCNNLRISHELLKQILELSRETVIPDLHKVVYDSMARFEYFAYETEWQPETHEFLLHAIFLLTGLKSEESLDVLFDILRQDEEYLDYWLNDCLTEDVWDCFLILGFNQWDKFKSFLFEPNHYLYAREIFSGIVVQIALHFPERKEEAIDWFTDIIKEILARKEDDNIIDTDWIGSIVSDLLDLDAVDLLPLIKQLFDEEMVSLDICGDYNDVVEEFKTKVYSKDKKKNIFNDIFSRYEHIITTWNYYTTNREQAENDSYENDYEFEENNLLPTNINFSKKTGRNDPCPCGSGKKYKKCCLK